MYASFFSILSQAFLGGRSEASENSACPQIAKKNLRFSLCKAVRTIADFCKPSSFGEVVTFRALRGIESNAMGEKMIHRGERRRLGRLHTLRAFTLVEMMAVIAIIILMLSLLAPAINSFTSTAGRKGALNILMNTFEQARAAALESGVNVYVIFWKRQFPERDCVIVMREPLEWNKDESAKFAKGDMVYLTRYLQMPTGVLLYDGKGKNVFKSGTPHSIIDQLPKVGGTAPKADEVGFIQFSPTGAILHPEDKDYSRLYVSEGVRGTNGTEALIANKKEGHGGFEIITFRRFTGRASVDVSTLD